MRSGKRKCCNVGCCTLIHLWQKPRNRWMCPCTFSQETWPNPPPGLSSRMSSLAQCSSSPSCMVRTVAFARLGETWCRPYLLCKPDAGTEHAGKLVGRGRGTLMQVGFKVGSQLSLRTSSGSCMILYCPGTFKLSMLDTVADGA